MFANTAGGLLLIGVSERRDKQGQPTGGPDPTAELGIELSNPDSVLSAYDARITAAVEERLPLEMAAIEIGKGRHVLAIRVPDSVRKPHAVTYQGHIYFPGRRERQRYALSVREIKELTMRTISRFEQSKEALGSSFQQITLAPSRSYLTVGLLPVFSEDFLVDLRPAAIQQAVRIFGRTYNGEFGNVTYSFDGIERRDAGRFDHLVQFRRNGLLRVSQQLTISDRQGMHHVGPIGIDLLLHQVFQQARSLYQAAGIGPPYIAGVTLSLQRELMGIYPSPSGPWEEPAALVEPNEYKFPFMQIDDLINTDRILRPISDQVHQLFGKEGSPSFNTEGLWIQTNR